MPDPATPTEGGAALLVLSGEIDIARVDELLVDATARLDEPGDLLQIDLGGVTFIDSSGLGALVHVRNDATARGKRLVLVRPAPQVLRVFAVSGLDQVFEIEPGG